MNLIYLGSICFGLRLAQNSNGSPLQLGLVSLEEQCLRSLHQLKAFTPQFQKGSSFFLVFDFLYLPHVTLKKYNNHMWIESMGQIAEASYVLFETVTVAWMAVHSGLVHCPLPLLNILNKVTSTISPEQTKMETPSDISKKHTSVLFVKKIIQTKISSCEMRLRNPPDPFFVSPALPARCGRGLNRTDQKNDAKSLVEIHGF